VSTLFDGVNLKSILTVLSIILIRPKSFNSGTISVKLKHSTPNYGSAITLAVTAWSPVADFVYLKYFWACLALLYIFLWYGPIDCENIKTGVPASSFIGSYKCSLSTDGPLSAVGISPPTSVYFKSLLWAYGS